MPETLFLTGYVLFVLLLFQPFGTHEYQHPYKLLQLFGYALLALVFYPVLRLSLLFLFSGPYSVRKEAGLLSLSFTLLIVSGFFYHALVIVGQVDWQRLLPFTINGIIVLILPFCALLYHSATKAKKQTVGQARAATLEIKGTSQYENFYFNAADVLYLRSNGNYVMIYFQKEGQLKHEMVRNTLSQVSGQLPGASFTAIHRSFLVNIKKFDKLLREDGKHVLLNKQFEIRLPVSRNQVPLIEKKLKDHS